MQTTSTDSSGPKISTSLPSSDDKPLADDEDHWPDPNSDDELDSDFDSMASDDDGSTDDDMSNLGDDSFSVQAATSTEVQEANANLTMKAATAPIALRRAFAKPATPTAITILCVVCGKCPAYNQGGKSYPTCVEAKFKNSWKQGTLPTIKHVYKIVEGVAVLKPYDTYRKKIGNQVFRYHGTTRQCQVGDTGHTTLCNSPQCAVCDIIKTSFKLTFAKPTGAFGAGLYTSSASNKAYSYGNAGGVVLLTKVVLGRVYNVSRFTEVTSLPAGYNSVVFDRMNGVLNETIVYSDDAIRPVFLLIF
ncbi:uncharacterized protein FIBRA_05709 [Fibroporia radiculosa]|uniref:PARP catalytic domain-containing protein n=1 Tax=Fibroporia radiculosa TaxID=599839 RepID=J4G9Z2_9APHY|nr:uncharacterized protein FIBRA_05709 [Fibroporia radiculosa]CCM03573.1 predicted protein [Fibroporia radiculosa]